MPIHAHSEPGTAMAQLATMVPNPDTPWCKQGHLLRLNITIVSLMLFSSAVGYDGALLNGLQALPQWAHFMDTPTGAWSGFINVVYWVGLGLSCPVGSWISNHWGRRLPIALAFIPLAVGAGLQAGAKTQAQWIVGRFLIGIPSAFFSVTVPVLITEIAYPTHRSVITATVNAAFFIGAVVAAWACYGARNYTDWSWRIPCLLQIACPISALPGLVFGPESPRWLVSQGRENEARELLGRIHAGGDSAHALVEFEMNEITTAIAAEKQAHATTSYLTMVSTPAHRRRFFVTASLGVFSQWVGNGDVSYYLSTVLNTVGITDVSNQTLISGCLQIWSLVTAMAGAFCVEKMGRRPLLLLSCGIMFVSFVIITALSGSFATTKAAATGTAMIPFIFVFNAGYSIAVTPLQVAYPIEIWPYNLRGRGISLVWMVMVVAVVFNVFVNPIALDAIGWKYYIVFVVILIVYGFTIFFFYPETKGYTLEEMDQIFGDDPEQVEDEISPSKNLGNEKDDKQIE